MIPALLRCDAYKLGHADQYPKGTEFIYSNFTPRSIKHFNVPESFYDRKIVVFGTSAFLREFNQIWFDTFFNKNKFDVINSFIKYTKNFYPHTKDTQERLFQLHNNRYLPLEFRFLPEGSLVNPGTPILTVTNTSPEFYWLPNFIESWLSADLWKVVTISNIARVYRNIVEYYAEKTSDSTDFVDYQCHDFSLRGMSGIEDAAFSSMGHLLFFKGTDSVPSYLKLKQHYRAIPDNIGSVPATEHSVMCAGGQDSEIETFSRLMDTYPTGPLSIVSDTWDFFKVITEYASILKDKILERDGTVVFRPDSGNPIDIICGTGDNTPEGKGALRCLWDIFGGTINSKGYKVLNPKVRLIYGDSITLHIASNMLEKMLQMGYSSENIVLGVGSYSYNYITRDTLGFAMKATNQTLNGKEYALFKNPKTDSGLKKSAKGYIKVIEDQDGRLVAIDNQKTYINYDDAMVRYTGNVESIKEIKTRILHYTGISI